MCGRGSPLRRGPPRGRSGRDTRHKRRQRQDARVARPGPASAVRYPGTGGGVVTPLEDDVRERFASIAAPDVAAPTTSLLRKRAHRIRTTRIIAAVASIAVVAGGIGIGATSLLTRPQHAEFAAGVTAIPAHVDGASPHAKQWQVASESVGGEQKVAASFLQGDQPCIAYDGGGWCHADGQTSEV